jgi:plastocyanin
MRYGILKFVALGAIVVVMSACGGSDAASTPTSASNAMTINILRQNGAQSFAPNPALAGGQMVVFKNTDSVTHRVTLNDGNVDTGDIAPGAISRVPSRVHANHRGQHELSLLDSRGHDRQRQRLVGRRAAAV